MELLFAGIIMSLAPVLDAAGLGSETHRAPRSPAISLAPRESRPTAGGPHCAKSQTIVKPTTAPVNTSRGHRGVTDNVCERSVDRAGEKRKGNGKENE